MAGIVDILTAANNIVTAINNATKAYLNVNGSTSVMNMTAATLVKSSPGRICSVSVVVAGAATGTVYDANVSTATTNPIYTIPMTAGVYVVNIPTQVGIVVKPGSGQTISVSFS